MKTHKITISILANLTAVSSLSAEPVVTDDFESGSFSDDWDETIDSEIFDDDGAQGSSSYANVLGQSGLLGAIIEEEEASDVAIDFYTRIQSAGGRTFNVMVRNEQAISNGGAAINLRHENGWAAFNGSWQNIDDLPPMDPDVWYRVRVTCRGWSSPGASYDIELSDADGMEFTSSVKGLTFYQGGDPNSAPVGSFNFVTAWGNNPGFDVDNVVVETIEAVAGDDPNIAIDSTTPFDFVELGPNPDPETVDLTVENNGATNSLTIADTTAITGEAAANFSVLTGLPLTIDPQGTGELKIQFDALDQFGQFNATLNLRSNDPSNPSVPVALSVFVPSADGSQLANGDFEESDQTLVRWTVGNDPDLAASPETGFAPGSKVAASVPAGQILAQNVTAEGDWFTDFYFQIPETGSRALNFVIRYPPGGEVNIRIQGSGEAALWNVFTVEDSWGEPLELPIVEPDMTYFLRVVGHDWEGAEPTYDILLSEPGETQLVHRLEGMDRFRNTIPTSGPSSIEFTAVFGGNQGFLVDDARFANGAPPDDEDLFPFEITSFRYTPATKESTIMWTTKPGTSYGVQSSLNLRDWLELDDGTAESAEVTFTEENVDSSALYYRIINQ